MSKQIGLYGDHLVFTVGTDQVYREYGHLPKNAGPLVGLGMFV